MEGEGEVRVWSVEERERVKKGMKSEEEKGARRENEPGAGGTVVSGGTGHPCQFAGQAFSGVLLWHAACHAQGWHERAPLHWHAVPIHCAEKFFILFYFLFFIFYFLFYFILFYFQKGNITIKMKQNIFTQNT